MEALIQVLPNLSIGVISILALVYTIRYFMDKMETMHERHRDQLDQRDMRMREFEKEVRTTTMVQLNENTKLFQRVVDHLHLNE